MTGFSATLCTCCMWSPTARSTARSEGGRLHLCDRYGRAAPVTAEQLGPRLGQHDPLRLLVLNACHTAGATDDGGFARRLVRQDVADVVAMQRVLGDAAAATFSKALYAQLGSGIRWTRLVSLGSLSLTWVVQWDTPDVSCTACLAEGCRCGVAEDPLHGDDVGHVLPHQAPGEPAVVGGPGGVARVEDEQAQRVVLTQPWPGCSAVTGAARPYRSHSCSRPPPSARSTSPWATTCSTCATDGTASHRPRRGSVWGRFVPSVVVGRGDRFGGGEEGGWAVLIGAEGQDVQAGGHALEESPRQWY